MYTNQENIHTHMNNVWERMKRKKEKEEKEDKEREWLIE